MSGLNDLQAEVTIDVITNVLKKVIGVKSIDHNDKFLDLEINSVSLFMSLVELEEYFGVEIPPDIFLDPEKSTIKYISEQIDSIVLSK